MFVVLKPSGVYQAIETTPSRTPSPPLDLSTRTASERIAHDFVHAGHTPQATSVGNDDVRPQPLTLTPFAMLPSARVAPTRRTPAQSEAPELLGPVVNRRDIGYARHLRLMRPDLDIETIAGLSGTGTNTLAQDPAFVMPRASIDAILTVAPSIPDERPQAHARRIRAAFPALKPTIIAMLSGADARALFTPPAFEIKRPQLAAIMAALPRHAHEGSRSYARRVRGQYPEISIPQLAQLAGCNTSNLRSDPAFAEVTPRLQQIRRQLPRHGTETKTQYAHRLKVSGLGVSAREVAILSMLDQRVVRRRVFADAPARAAHVDVDVDVGVHPVPTARVVAIPDTPVHTAPRAAASVAKTAKNRPTKSAAQMREAIRMPGEPKIVCARRLRLHRPDLSEADIRSASGALGLLLRTDDAFSGPMDTLRDILATLPRHDEEGALAYATRLRQHHPDLSNIQLDMLSGAGVPTLHANLSTTVSDPALDHVAQVVPHVPGESFREHARRVRHQFPGLNKAQLARIVGSNPSNLRADPRHDPPSDIAKRFRGEIPRGPDETGVDYARRVRASQPTLSPRELAQIAGLNESNIRQYVTNAKSLRNTASSVGELPDPQPPRTPPADPPTAPSGNSTPTTIPRSMSVRRSTPY